MNQRLNIRWAARKAADALNVGDFAASRQHREHAMRMIALEDDPAAGRELFKTVWKENRITPARTRFITR